jgi:hypothetical protein
MTGLDALLGDEDSPEAPVEVVTLTADELSRGATSGTSHSAPDLESALVYARTLTPDQQERTWLRSPRGTMTMGDAETELAARRVARE